MRALLILSLGLLLSACGGSSSSSANNAGTPDSGTPDNSTPDTGSGGDSGSSDGNSGDGDSGDSGGTTTPEPVDCNWQTPADVTPGETLGDTADSETYDLSSYSERTDLNTDLTGSWVLVHKITSIRESAGYRTTTVTEQKTHFVIRDNGGQLQASVCDADGTGFADLSDTSAPFNLPLFGAGSAPTFTLTRNTALTGNAVPDNSSSTYLNQSTRAIKIADAASAYGQSSITFDGSSDNNADVYCYSQKRERQVQQQCTASAGATEVALFLVLGTSSGQQSLSYDSFPYWTLGNDNQVMIQTSAPGTFSISSDASSLSVNVALDSAFMTNGTSNLSGTMTSSLTLP